jgi:DNA polymerase
VNISTQLPCQFLDRAVNGGEEECVGGDLNPIGIAEARSALAWWLEAGVDVAVQDEPRNWLKPQSRPGTAPAPGLFPQAQAPNVVQPRHDTLAELQQWLASSVELPLVGRASKRIAPHGPQDAAVMLLTGAPTLDDAAAGQPIAGDAWALTRRMLAAIAIDADDAYSASLSLVHSPGTRMSESDRQACAAIARRHIALVRPRRLLLFGDEPCLALLGKHLVEARGHVHKIEGVRAVATFHPRQLVNHPSKKAMAWRDLLLLMEDES